MSQNLPKSMTKTNIKDISATFLKFHFLKILLNYIFTPILVNYNK